MPHSTAGEARGEEPTYWMKCSSIWATRPSLTSRLTWPDTVRCIRIDSTSLRVASDMPRRTSMVSRRSSTDFQKKNRSETSAMRSATLRNAS